MNGRYRRSGSRKSKHQRVLQALSTWGEDDGVSNLVQALLESSKHKTFVRVEGDSNDGVSLEMSHIKQSLREVSDEHFTTVVKVLCSSRVAPYNDETLKDKHPYKSPLSKPRTTFSKPPLVIGVNLIFKCIKSFPKGTSCGRDGLRAHHLLDVMCSEGSTVATGLLRALSSVVNLWIGCKCPLSLLLWRPLHRY